MSESERATDRRDLLIGLLLAIVTCGVFWGATGHAFVAYDDPQYVTSNRHVLSGLSWENVKWAFTAGHAANWHPLTWLSHMLDVQLFGVESAWGHHAVSVLLHALNAALLFAALRKLGADRWSGAMVAALFALHPLRVESVAWVAERKDVLSGLFWMTTLLAYAAYARAPSIGRYLLVAASFALGLLAKPMLVTLPFLLLLLDAWPLRRWKSAGPLVLLEKLPLVALAAASSIATVLVQQSGGTVRTLEAIPAGARIANAFCAYGAYLLDTVWPSGLACFYPHAAIVAPDGYSMLNAGAVAGVLVVAAVSALAVQQRRHRPYLGVGWFWYLGTLVPVIGFVQVGNQSMADRYSYLPQIGLAIVVVWAAGELARRFERGRVVATIVALAVLAACGVLTRMQVRHWRDSFTLFERALAVTDDNYVAHANLGVLRRGSGEHARARRHFEDALAIKPDSAEAHNGLGLAFVRDGNLRQAIYHYGEAIRHDPTLAQAYSNLGVALLNTNELDLAKARLLRAIELDPELAEAKLNLGLVQQRLGDTEGMVASFRGALEQMSAQPPSILAMLAAGYAELGDFEEAVRWQRQALDNAPAGQRDAFRAALSSYENRRQ